MLDVHLPIRLLIDEDLSPWVAQRLREEDGIDAIGVRDRGMLAAPDREVLDFAFAEDRILLTANVADFVRLASARERHPGIILLLDGELGRREQLSVVRFALPHFPQASDPRRNARSSNRPQENAHESNPEVTSKNNATENRPE